MEGEQRQKTKKPRRTPNPDEGEPSSQERDQGEQRIDTMEETLHKVTDILMVITTSHRFGPRVEQGEPEIGKDMALERFLRFSPPKFNGDVNPDTAEKWLENMVNIF